MDKLYVINDLINGLVWGPYMIAFIIGTGIFFSFKLKWIQIRHFIYIMKNTIGNAFKKGNPEDGQISSGQAGFSSIAGVVGTGNLAGVGTAIAMGGPGAIFWMWVAAFFGMATKFAEITLGIKYREKNKQGHYSGGPMYYLEKGLGKRWVAVLFSIFIMASFFVIGAIVDTNTIAISINEQWGINQLLTGIIFAILTGIVIFGGIKSIGTVCEKLTPFMGGLYILVGLGLIGVNISKVPQAFGLIFTSAFKPAAATGGFAGATVARMITMGTARGLFSNEAGMGSSPIIHSSAQVEHPIEQGIWGITEVFFDTIIICTITALAIILSGEWVSGASGVALTMNAFTSLMGSLGSYIVLITAILFGYSCLITTNYYVESAGRYLWGEKVTIPIRIIWLIGIVIGSVGGLEFVWDLSDTVNGLLIIPNLIGVIYLSSQVTDLKNEYFSNVRSKVD